MKRAGEISFDGFLTFYQNLLYDEKLFKEYFNSYSSNKRRVTLQEFTTFLSQEQKDPLGEDERGVREFMLKYLQDPTRDSQEPFYTVQEFLDFLFSKQNDMWDPRHGQVNQDMTLPLTRYWIASSHNTYLTGDQVRSESSTDAYARCLRMGCRCIERE